MDSTHEQCGAEVELVRTVAGGDLHAFERLYQLYEKRVFHYVCTLVRDRGLAEEVVSDVMVAVWKGAGTFAQNSRVSTWILAIARHKALDAVRRTSRHDQRAVDLEEAPELPSEAEGPLEHLQREQAAQGMNRALNRLTTDHREVLRLAFYEELPYEEIAILLGIPENTVKTRVFYAKQHLKKELDRLTQRESV